MKKNCMNCTLAGRRPHELAKLSRLYDGFASLRCRNLPQPVRFDIERRGGCGDRDPRGQKPATPRHGKGVQKFWSFLNDGSAFTNYYMFHVLFDFSKKF